MAGTPKAEISAGSWGAGGLSRVLPGLQVYGIAISLSFGVIAAISAVLGYPVLDVLKTLITSSFRSFAGLKSTIKVSIPLLFTTYAFSIPFKIKFFNIGAWGQMMLGGAMTAVVGLLLADWNLPAVVLIPLLVLTALLAGGALAWIAAYLKADYDINPIVSTIMLNYVAFQGVALICTARGFTDPKGGHPQTMLLPSSTALGFVGGIPYSLLLAALAVVLVSVLINRTRLGYEINAIGYNPVAAQSYGIDFRRTLMLTFFCGGALAGLGGGLEVLNIHNRLLVGFADISGVNFGALGVLAALVVAGNPMAVPVAAFLMSVLLVGADRLQRTMQVPVELVFLLQAIIVLLIVITRAKLSAKR
jgi:general nucleoside transport system permease protein